MKKNWSMILSLFFIFIGISFIFFVVRLVWFPPSNMGMMMGRAMMMNHMYLWVHGILRFFILVIVIFVSYWIIVNRGRKK